MSERKLYPRENLEDGMLVYDSDRKVYIVYSYFDAETGEYTRTLTTADEAEAWTAYFDGVDAMVRRKIKKRRAKK